MPDFEMQIIGNFATLFKYVPLSIRRDLEAHVSNRSKYGPMVEFGTGIYNESGFGTQSPIYPKNAKALIIPIFSRYTNRFSSDIIEEANNNILRYPELFARLSGQYRGLQGFIFRTSIRGMKPVRMLRKSMPATRQYIQELWIESMKPGFYENPRENICRILNLGAAFLLAEVSKRTPVLTSTLKSAWTISKLAE